MRQRYPGALSTRAVLLLNAACEPMRFVSAKDAIKKILVGKAVSISTYREEFYPGLPVPSVVRLLHYNWKHSVKHGRKVSRRNIMMRDGRQCQYCGVRSHELTLDHILPKSRGGKGTWENLVACCGRCNHKKGNMTPEEASMPLLRRPMPSNIHSSRNIMRALAAGRPEWDRFLFADPEHGESRLVLKG